MKLFELLSVDNHIKIRTARLEMKPDRIIPDWAQVQRTHRRGGVHSPFPMIIPRIPVIPIHDFHFVED